MSPWALVLGLLVLALLVARLPRQRVLRRGRVRRRRLPSALRRSRGSMQPFDPRPGGVARRVCPGVGCSYAHHVCCQNTLGGQCSADHPGGCCCCCKDWQVCEGGKCVMGCGQSSGDPFEGCCAKDLECVDGKCRVQCKLVGEHCHATRSCCDGHYCASGTCCALRRAANA
jgi:hypothetical protein